eukprot:NODE_67_length_25542_cov_1.476831.p8 type:complete len:364 gc:universal NODE_67_length_25542_cov_1.476831:1871-2962(+)
MGLVDMSNDCYKNLRVTIMFCRILRNRVAQLRETLKSDTTQFDEFIRMGQNSALKRERLPEWLRGIKANTNSKLIKDLRSRSLHTVCEEAKCPNINECWSGGTATIMLMGGECTRACRFCSVKTSRNPKPLDPNEPQETAEVVDNWYKKGFKYVVLTSVDRDDLMDFGAHHFAQTVTQILSTTPNMLVECLVGDHQNDKDCIKLLVDSKMHVFAHNIETVERCTPFVRDRRAKYRQSMEVLQFAKRYSLKARKDRMLTKSSIMLGCGETESEIIQTLRDLRKHDVDVVTLGQYMQPTKGHLKVVKYYSPKEFKHYENIANDLGFKYVASGPLVRSSYKAGEYYIENMLRGNNKQNFTSGENKL